MDASADEEEADPVEAPGEVADAPEGAVAPAMEPAPSPAAQEEPIAGPSQHQHQPGPDATKHFTT